ncbi:MAG: Rrf2 family transcriptional regulator [Candidatus Omnitrophica bacterium]|nr:Rrf2 family transcriptional regulator [Candidatus Omnitrophota bacterium]
MKLITRDTDYALRAICFIAKKKNKKVCVPELVEGLKIPKPFLRKILQVLNKEKILISYKGIGGGFVLAKQPKDIYLTDLMEIFQGGINLNECTLHKMKCPNTSICPLRKKIRNIEKYVINKLSEINLASFV